jgi:hypothetical protein
MRWVCLAVAAVAALAAGSARADPRFPTQWPGVSTSGVVIMCPSNVGAYVPCGSPSALSIPVTVNTPPNPNGNVVSGSGSATGTGATTIIKAPNTGRLYVTGTQCFRTDAGTSAVYVTLNDAASTVIGLANSGGGGGNNMVFTSPLLVAAQTALTFTASGSISTIYCNAQGYVAP